MGSLNPVCRLQVYVPVPVPVCKLNCSYNLGENYPHFLTRTITGHWTHPDMDSRPRMSSCTGHRSEGITNPEDTSHTGHRALAASLYPTTRLPKPILLILSLSLSLSLLERIQDKIKVCKTVKYYFP
jgi:hypothetical protein